MEHQSTNTSPLVKAYLWLNPSKLAYLIQLAGFQQPPLSLMLKLVSLLTEQEGAQKLRTPQTHTHTLTCFSCEEELYN